jgi:hypothetical protein
MTYVIFILSAKIAIICEYKTEIVEIEDSSARELRGTSMAGCDGLETPHRITIFPETFNSFAE